MTAKATMAIPSRQKGFTLTEVLVVVLIMGILGGAALPAVTRTILSYQLRFEARELVINLKKARIEAVRQGESVLVDFDVAADSYRIFVDLDGDGVFTAEDDAELLNHTLRANVQMTQSTFPAGFGFDPRGLPLVIGAAGRTCQIRGARRGSPTYVIVVAPAGNINLRTL